MATQTVNQAAASDEKRVFVRFSPPVQADYDRRGVFPHLCKAGDEWHRLTDAEANNVFDDAEARRIHPDCPRYTKSGFTALARNLVASFRRRALAGMPAPTTPIAAPAPSPEDEHNMGAKGPAAFRPGDKCIDNRNGDELVITKGHTVHVVTYDGVPHMAREGYIARDAAGNDRPARFYRAADLVELDGRPRHMQMLREPKPEPVAPKRARPFQGNLLKSTAAKMDPKLRRIMAEAIGEGVEKGWTTAQIIRTIREEAAQAEMA